jgi:hypothetical protein
MRAGEGRRPHHPNPKPSSPACSNVSGTDPLWATEYRDYVQQVSFAAPGELIGFDRVLAALKDLIALVGPEARG